MDSVVVQRHIIEFLAETKCVVMKQIRHSRTSAIASKPSRAGSL